MIATAADIVRKAIENCKRATTIKTEDLPDIIIEKPKRDEFGDFATNVAMLLAGKEGKPPRQIAEAIAKEIRQIENIKKVEVAGHGFINIFIDDEYWLSLLKEAHNLKEKYGTSDAGSGKKVQVEFVSANPTGPLHIGHGRGAAVGDSLANILKAAGYKVVKEYYVNDAGRQVYILGESVRKRMEELQGKDVEFSDDYYKGEYVKEIAKDFLAERSSAGKAQSTSTVQDFACEAMLERIKKDLQDFGVEFDNWFSEKTLEDEGLVNNAIEELRKNGYIYEDEGAVWFRTTQLGDDKDRVLIKADNEKTYFASDIAYHKKKAESGFSTIVNIWGADHHGYEARVRAALKAFGYDDNILKIIFIQLVALLRNGVQVPMGKREGEFVTLRQVIDEVGKDACRFFFLMRKSDAQLEFDLELAKKQAPENPVFYVQYAHARICSIIKHAEEKGMALPTHNDIDLSLLNQNEEMSIIKTLASFPDIIKDCALSLEPHRLTFYLQELAAIFHPYYNKNRVVSNDIPLSKARLFLCIAVKTVIKNGLSLLKVSAPEVM